MIAGIGFLGGIGLPVASLLAGLGIGGIALAFGAQKTVENLFGAVAIGVDRPFREGDFVKVEDNVMGTVEDVGLRSTRIRTLDRTIVTLPNGRLSDMRIETYTLRDRIRLATVLNLVYETTAAQMREVLAGFEDVLRKHPSIWPDEIIVRFMQFGASSLDIEVMCWFTTTDFNKFRVIRQDVLLAFMEVVEKAGSASRSRRRQSTSLVLQRAPMLTGKQRRHLRALGHELKPIVQVGKDGIDEGLIARGRSSARRSRAGQDQDRRRRRGRPQRGRRRSSPPRPTARSRRCSATPCCCIAPIQRSEDQAAARREVGSGRRDDRDRPRRHDRR